MLDEQIALFLNKLCTTLSKKSPAAKNNLLDLAVRLLTIENDRNSIKSTKEYDIMEKLTKRIETNDSAETALKFQYLLRKLQQIDSVSAEARIAFLHFLFQHSFKKKIKTYSSSKICQSVDSEQEIELQQPFTSCQQLSVFDNDWKSDHSMDKFSFKQKDSTASIQSNTTKGSASVSCCNQLCTKASDNISCTTKNSLSSVKSLNAFTAHESVSHQALIQELIYSFYGIEGKILRLEPTGGFRIDPKYNLTRSERTLVLRLAETGFLHNKIREFCENSGKQMGLVYYSMVSAFRNELTDFYKLIAILQENFMSKKSSLTLQRLLVWLVEPHNRLKWLVILASAAKYKKGGELISCIYQFLQHGSPLVQSLVQQLLNEVCRPLLTFISRWILGGIIDDSSGEYFIEARPDISGDRLWHEKYRLRNAMIPSFITMEQASKILATGKSIDFLREVCQETPPSSSNALKELFESSNVTMFYQNTQCCTFQTGIDTVFSETSRRVLDVLLSKYKLLLHLHAMKRYLLLGQGDFIRHLMEVLLPELSLPAVSLKPLNLSAILESAIRSTNAQYDDPDVLARLDVKIMQDTNAKQDTGWDVFSLIYHSHGPIGTVLKPCESQYLTLFHCLWNFKRMEFILSVLWKNLTTSARAFRNIKGMSPVMQMMHLLTSEMNHFVHQMQYYVLFEVLECNWVEFMKELETAQSLDDVLGAHQKFLKTVKKGAFLEDSSEELSRQIRNIYNHVIQLQVFQERFNTQAQAEYDAEKERERRIDSCDGFATSDKEEQIRNERQLRFQQVLLAARGRLSTLSTSYQKHVRRFLSLLVTQPDVSLQLLGLRIDFNGRYKHLSRQTSRMSHTSSASLELEK